MLVYKVVYSERYSDYRRYYSCCQNICFPDKYRVKYIIGKEVKPKVEGTMLFAFSSLDEAKDFLNSFGNISDYSILECEAKRVIKNVIPQYIGEYHFAVFWLNFNKAFKAKKKLPKEGITPMSKMKKYQTSVCCPSLIPLRTVTNVRP